MVPEATAALPNCVGTGRALAVLGGVALDRYRPGSSASRTDLTFTHPHQYPRPGQRIFPASSGSPCSAPGPLASLPQPSEGWLKGSDPVLPTPYVNACPWLSVALGLKPKLLPWPGSGPFRTLHSRLGPAALASFPLLQGAELIPAARPLHARSLLRGALFHRSPAVMPSDSCCFYLKSLSSERARWFLPTPTFLPCLFSSTF